jgi:16S rRNA (uracil1498-N3)-methyltransferase
LKQFILNSLPDTDGLIRLSGGDYHYLVRVRRLAPGEHFPCLLPSGDEALVQVLSVDGGMLVGRCTEILPEERCHRTEGSLQTPQPILPPILLFQALPKGDKMDLIVRQAAEGAVSEIVPFTSEFSAPKTKNPDKVQRWERIIREARQQSGSRIPTRILPPYNTEGLLKYWNELKSSHPEAVGIFFHQIPLEKGSLHEYLDKSLELVALAIGPEGGFSPGEAAQFLEAGFKPLTIGDTVLRTETAALYGAAAIRTILLESDSWTKVPL